MPGDLACKPHPCFPVPHTKPGGRRRGAAAGSSHRPFHQRLTAQAAAAAPAGIAQGLQHPPGWGCPWPHLAEADGAQHAAGRRAQEGNWYPCPTRRCRASPETCLLLGVQGCPRLSRPRVAEGQQPQAWQQGRALCNRMAEAHCCFELQMHPLQCPRGQTFSSPPHLPHPPPPERTKDQKYSYIFLAFSLKKVLIGSVQQNEVWQHHSQIVSQIKTERALNNWVQIKKTSTVKKFFPLNRNSQAQKWQQPHGDNGGTSSS